MEKGKGQNKSIKIIIGAIVIVLLCCALFYYFNRIKFNITDTNINLKIGEKRLLEYSLSNPELIVEWSSDSNSVSVDQNGIITANNYGLATITGIINDDGKTITSSVQVTPYSGDIGVTLEKVDAPSGYFLMKPNSEMELPFTIIPNNAYLTSVDYNISDSNIAVIENNKIISKNPGLTTLKATFNNNIFIKMDIKVSNDVDENILVKAIEKITFNDSNTMENGEIRSLSYNITPQDAYIDTIEWFSSNESVIKINNDNLEAVGVGTSVITVKINGKEESTTITVKENNSDIVIDYNPKLVIKPGESTTIKAHAAPINTTIKYESSNPSVAKVENGVITGVSQGNTIITASLVNGKKKTFTINVLPSTGRINDSGIFWGYKSLNSKTPTYADIKFFQQLAQNGVGVLQDNNYVITSAGLNYSYNIDQNILTVSNKKINLRIYYPEGVDLSITNTLVYMGGRGETDFYGVFSDVKKNSSIIKSGGIVALIAEGKKTSFDGESGAYVTKFLKAITKQKSGVKNSILGFSDGAHQVFHASKTEVYDRIVIFSGYIDIYNYFPNAKNTEIIFMIGSNDGNYSQSKIAINNLLKLGYKNITMVSMGNDLSRLVDKILIINPGKLMKNAHVSENVINSGIIEYLND